MPADMPPAPAAFAIPYYRVISFLAGGSVALVLLLLLSNLIKVMVAR
jgi:hypothetical protein